MTTAVLAFIFLAQTAPPLQQADALVKAGETEKAIASLEQAAANGFMVLEPLLADNVLIPIRSDARWPKIVEAVRNNAHPCRNAPEHRQFDFWLGEWDVNTRDARTARSSIQLILDQCVIFENYDAGPYSGKSFSSYVPEAKGWKQHYVDSHGDNSEWSGRLEGEKMVFLSRGKSLQRMTYSKEGPDRVRQLIEISTDDGKTWSPEFDGMYVRRK
jgi:hypothetical protein